MSGRKVLLDINVLIQASRQQLDLAGLFAAYDEFYVSVITYMEVYAYDFEDPEGRNLIDRLFEALEIIGIDMQIAGQAILYRKNKRTKIRLPDAIILATAKCFQPCCSATIRTIFKELTLML